MGSVSRSDSSGHSNTNFKFDSRPSHRPAPGLEMSRDGKDGAAATWGAQQFDAAPSPDQLKKIQDEEAAQKAKSAAPQQRLSVVDAAKTIKPDDFLKIHQLPCARQGLLTGIGGGAALGVLRYILGGQSFRIRRSASIICTVQITDWES